MDLYCDICLCKNGIGNTVGVKLFFDIETEANKTFRNLPPGRKFNIVPNVVSDGMSENGLAFSKSPSIAAALKKFKVMITNRTETTRIMVVIFYSYNILVVSHFDLKYLSLKTIRRRFSII